MPLGILVLFLTSYRKNANYGTVWKREAAIPDQGAIKRQSEVNQWQSEAIRGNQCEKSEAIDGNQRSKWSSEAISVAISGNQWSKWSSEAISGGNEM